MKLRNPFKKQQILRKSICEILDGDWDGFEDEIKLGIGIMLIEYKHSEGSIEASTYIPYLDSAGIKYDGKSLQRALNIIRKYELIKDSGKPNFNKLDCPIEWGLAANIFLGLLERKWDKKKKDWLYKMLPEGKKYVEEKILKK